MGTPGHYACSAEFGVGAYKCVDPPKQAGKTGMEKILLLLIASDIHLLPNNEIKILIITEKKVELHPGAILENGATLEGGAVFFP